MSHDFDSIGYWLKGIPYVWIPSGKLEECKRYYFINGGMGAYDSENRLSTQSMWTRITVQAPKKLLDIELFILPCKENWVRKFFGIFPFDTRTWRISGGKFLVSPPIERGSWIPESEWDETRSGFELRMEGKKVDVVPGVPEERIFADLVLPSGKIMRKNVVFAPGWYSSSLAYPIFGFSSEGAAVRSKKTGKQFTTITELAEKLKLSLQEKKMLHQKCLGNNFEYRYIFFKENDPFTREKMRVAADWVNDVWSGKIQWGGPSFADVELFEHAPYQNIPLNN
uniref:Uncharacterized protein n=1 Tax=Marseillevirus sp. TaxID=2809551 RepID=A0AA96ESB5_9VIRU|nr:hypothetical protein MarFTMF_335 [Marseillevirus sp.]